MTNSNAMEFVITGLRIELRCCKCSGMVRWWNEDNKKIIPSRRLWSEEECSSMR
ncbi:MAG: hypothetical protein ACRD47_09680 [Nitrososphaeraceae archaeon]